MNPQNLPPTVTGNSSTLAINPLLRLKNGAAEIIERCHRCNKPVLVYKHAYGIVTESWGPEWVNNELSWDSTLCSECCPIVHNGEAK